MAWRDTTGRRIAAVAALAALYFVTGWGGLQLPYLGKHVTLLWPPVGIALAAVVLLGNWVAPGIVLGAFATSVAVGSSAGVAVGIAIGNTLGPVLAGHHLMHRMNFRPQLDRVRDVFDFLLVGVLGCSVITSLVGSLTLLLSGSTAPSALPAAWLAWLAGDCAGALLIGSLLLCWCSPPRAHSDDGSRRGEGVLLTVTLLVSILVIARYGPRAPSLAGLTAPVCLWAAIRFDMRGATAASLAVALLMAVVSAAGGGPFAGLNAEREVMISVWVYATSVPATVMFAAALFAERNEALEKQEILMRELDHRVKNTLALVASIAEQSGTAATDVAAFTEIFGRRIRALARSHEALARRRWEGIGIRELVEQVTAPYAVDDPHVLVVHGDDRLLYARTAAPLAMMLHELATNAAKYGAWKQAGGRVELSWGARDDGNLRLLWRETGGPSTQAPTARGFGLTVIEGLGTYELGGTVDLDFQESGLVCTIEIPAAGPPPASDGSRSA